MTGSRIALVLAIACLTTIAEAQQGAGNGDVLGNAAFKPGARLLYADDWSTTGVGDIPETIKLVAGTMEIVAVDGRHLLKISEGASFDLVLSEMLPESYTIDFDMRVPRSTGYSAEVRPEVPNAPAGYAGLSRRVQNPVVHCGAIGSGVYGDGPNNTRRFADRLAKALVPCEIIVTARSVKVYFAGELAANQPGANLGRGRRLRIYVPAGAGEEAFVGSVRVATDIGVDVAASAPASAPGAEPANPAADSTSKSQVRSVDSATSEPARPSTLRSPNGEQPTARPTTSSANLKELPHRIRKRAEARASERLDSATNRVERAIEASTEKALTSAGNTADRALSATDRIVDCLVSDLRCIRRARDIKARVALKDSAGNAISSADSARAMTNADQARSASRTKP